MCTSVLYYNNINKDHQKLATFNNNKYKSKQQNSVHYRPQNPTHFSIHGLETYPKHVTYLSTTCKEHKYNQSHRNKNLSQYSVLVFNHNILSLKHLSFIHIVHFKS